MLFIINFFIFLFLMFLKGLLLFGLCISQYLANMLGVDLGSDFFKATILKPGKPFTMVENLQSKTSTASGIAFKDDERIFGPDIFVNKARFPKQVINFVDRYLGEKYGSENLQKYIDDHFVSYDLSEDEERKTINFNVKFRGNSTVFTPEEVYGMLFRYLKFITEKFIDSRVYEVYISVPSSWGYKKRQSLNQAVSLAGLTLKGIVTQNTAAATHFMTDKSFNKTLNYIFYTIGSTYTQASLVSFSPKFEPKPNSNETVESKEINILAESWDSHLGGRDFDFNFVRLLMDIHDKSDQKKDKPTCKNPRVAEKILPSAIKYKEVLSANKQVGINILGIETGMNLVSMVSKEQFEEANSELFDRVYAPIEKLFELTGLGVQDIEQIEVLGGGVRVPKIQEILKEKLGANLIGAHMNGDDSFALGTCYIFANTTKHFKVKKRIFVNNGAPFKINIKINPFLAAEDAKLCDAEISNEILAENCVRDVNKTTTLYKIRHGFDISRTVSFKHDSDLNINVYEQMEGSDKEDELMTYTVTNFEEAKKEMKELNHTSLPKVNLRFRTNEVGILGLSADLTYEIPQYFTRIPGENNTYEYKYGNEFVEALTEDQLALELELLKAQGKNETDKEYTKIKNIGRTKKLEKKFNLKVAKEYTFPKPLTKKQIEESKKRLDDLDRLEELRLKNIEARNNLETDIYARREWLETDKARLYSKAEDIESLTKTLQEVYDWYDEEGYNAETEVLIAKHNEFKTPISLIESRRQKHEKRIKATEDLEKELTKINSDCLKVLEAKPWTLNYYNETMQLEIIKVTEWIEEKKIEQAKTPLHDDPVISSDLIDLKIRQIKREYTKFNTIPKPKEEKPVNATETESESSPEQKESKEETTNENKEEKKEEESNEQETKEEAQYEETNSEKQTSDESQSKDDPKVDL